MQRFFYFATLHIDRYLDIKACERMRIAVPRTKYWLSMSELREQRSKDPMHSSQSILESYILGLARVNNCLSEYGSNCGGES